MIKNMTRRKSSISRLEEHLESANIFDNGWSIPRQPPRWAWLSTAFPFLWMKYHAKVDRPFITHFLIPYKNAFWLQFILSCHNLHNGYFRSNGTEQLLLAVPNILELRAPETFTWVGAWSQQMFSAHSSARFGLSQSNGKILHRTLTGLGFLPRERCVVIIWWICRWTIINRANFFCPNLCATFWRYLVFRQTDRQTDRQKKCTQ